MKKNVKHLLTATACAAVIFSSCKREAVAPPAQSIDGMSEQTIKAEVGRVLNNHADSRYTMVVEGGNKLKSFYLNEAAADAMSEKINNFRNVNASINYLYTAVDVSTEITKVEKSKDEVSVWSTDTYKMVSNDPDPENPGKFITTMGEYQHFYKLALYNNEWKITAEKCENAYDPWYVNLDPLIGDPGPAAVGGRQPNSPAAIQYTYNRSAAVSYATQRWNNPNTAVYCDYGAGNGDCTNFVSQCLKSGGWTTSSNWFHNGAGCCNNTWACVITNCYSCSWNVAPNFYNYVLSSARGTGTGATRNCVNGDVVQQGSSSSSSSIGHTMIVTSTTGSGTTKMVYLTYRNAAGFAPALNKPFTQIGGFLFPWLLKNTAS